MKDWKNFDYSNVVTASDEAFVWQVLTFYCPIWMDEMVSGEDEDTETNSDNATDNGYERKMTKKSGPKKGFKETSGKTVGTFYSYVNEVGVSMNSKNAATWSKRLKLLAQVKDEEEKDKDREKEKSDVINTIAGEQDLGFMKYTKLRMSAFERSDVNNEDTVTEESDKESEASAASQTEQV
jgi:hypothetical protein